ncbi:MAG: hypothetical protein ACQERI_01955 [Candidatus Krumholzibacteriota bacterium]
MLLNLNSCRRLAFSTISFQDSSEEEIELRAHILSDPGEINQLFHSFLPDSGVLPVQAGIKNNSDSPIVILGGSFQALKERLAGVEMIRDSEIFTPLSPMEVMRIIMGGRGSQYRSKGSGKTAAGVMILPLGIYYVYDEATAGRLYRPLADESLFDTTDGFFFDPLRLEPGEQKTGYLYFPVSFSPYAREKVREEGVVRQEEEKLVLKEGFTPQSKLRAGMILAESLPAGVTADTLGFYDICFGKDEDMREGVPAVLLRNSGGKNSDSEIISLEYDVPDEMLKRDRQEILIDRLNSKAEIADADFRGGRGAFAVNFTRKSRVYLFSRENGRGFIWKNGLDRNVIGVILTEEGVIAACDNGFCYFMDMEDGAVNNRYRRLAGGLDDIIRYRGKVAALASESVRFFSTGKENPFQPLGQFEIAEGKKRALGISDGMITVLREHGDTGGDTISVIDPGNDRERGRYPVPGRVIAAASGKSSLLWLEGGVVLKIEPGADRARVVDGTFIPFEAKELTVSGGRAFAAGKGGVILSFNLEGMPANDYIDRVCPVGLSPPRREPEPRRRRIR